MAAQPAIKMNTVVGSPGMTSPSMPTARLVTASARSSQRVYQRRTMVGGGTGGVTADTSGLAGEGMLGIVPLLANTQAMVCGSVFKTVALGACQYCV